MIDLFVYGTLMAEAHVYALTGRHFHRAEAILPDFEKVAPEAGYSYVLPKPGASVRGLLLLDVDERSLEALDAYEEEGELYFRRDVAVIVAGTRRRGAAYIGNLSGLNRHSGEGVV